MQVDIQIDEMLITSATAGALMGYSARNWLRLVNAGKAPEGIYVSPSEKRWRLVDVREFLIRVWDDPSIVNDKPPMDMEHVRAGRKRGRPRKYDIDKILSEDYNNSNKQAKSPK